MFINLAHYTLSNGKRNNDNRNKEAHKEGRNRDGQGTCTLEGRVCQQAGSGESKGCNNRADKRSKGGQGWRRPLPVRQAVLQFRGTSEGKRKETTRAVSLALSPFLFFSTDFTISNNAFPQGFIILAMIFGLGYLCSRKYDIQTVISWLVHGDNIEPKK